MNESTTEIPISGICCGNSIVRAQKLIKSIAGVEAVRIDLARKVAIVRGSFDTQAVTDVIATAGFGGVATE